MPRKRAPLQRLCDAIMRSRFGFVVSPSICALLAAGCAATVSSERSLHPPTANVGSAAAASRVCSFDAVDLRAAFPKNDFARRVAFLNACSNSSQSTDPSVVSEAAALLDVYTASKTAEQFADGIKERFELVQTPVADESANLMTGYATPVVSVRLKEDREFCFPIFGDVRSVDQALAQSGRRELYASKQARATAIAWIDEPLALALVETNGTARLRVENSSPPREICISRIATNGRSWTSLGRALTARGLMPEGTTTLRDVISVSRANPLEAAAALMDNDRVVFFAATRAEFFPPTLGLRGGTLVAGYSVAADQSIYPAGALLVTVEASAESASGRPARFAFVHDAGGAISGAGRIDAYFGEGSEALLRAGEMRVPIGVYRLRLKK